jgi:Golgi nucleoside diphosphatase
MDYKVMDYIRPLLEFASTHIPEQYHKETPLYILATAGMRLLSKPKQDLILSSLRKGIISEYPFLFPEGNLEIISGRQEGIYQWLAINYVLGKLDYQLQMSKVRPTAQDKESKSGATQMVRPKTVGAIDMVSFLRYSSI